MVAYKFSLFAAMDKSFGSGVVVCMLALLIAGMVEAKCLDEKKITGVCKDFSLQVKSDSAEINATIKLRESVRGTLLRGNITIESYTIGGTFKSSVNIVANSAGMTVQQNSYIGLLHFTVPTWH
ncbi:hypothetical protein M3Y96_00474400 [Aphelenchoides besseyi]|nr:hypothetical protein M3Y96_00474400 [Aphelenchoides besseyi]